MTLIICGGLTILCLVLCLIADGLQSKRINKSMIVNKEIIKDGRETKQENK